MTHKHRAPTIAHYFHAGDRFHLRKAARPEPLAVRSEEPRTLRHLRRTRATRRARPTATRTAAARRQPEAAGLRAPRQARRRGVLRCRPPTGTEQVRPTTLRRRYVHHVRRGIPREDDVLLEQEGTSRAQADTRQPERGRTHRTALGRAPTRAVARPHAAKRARPLATARPTSDVRSRRSTPTARR
jgi:hypothetical protein